MALETQDENLAEVFAGDTNTSEQPMSESEIASLTQAELAASTEYDRSLYLQRRVRAIQYYRGEMKDLEPEDGRSSVTSRDVREAMSVILPSLMRVFFAGDELGEYQATKPEEEQQAKQASDYVNHLVIKEAHGYRVFWDVLHNALLHANGVVKHWWDTTPRYKTYSLTNLTDEQLTLLLQDDDIEVLEHTAIGEEEISPEGMQVQPTMHSVKLRHADRTGKLSMIAVPPEEFLIDMRATDLETARFMAHRSLRMRSEAIEMGFDADLVNRVPAFSSLEYDRVELARREEVGIFADTSLGMDRSTELIEIDECYVKADYDRDGVAETLRVYMGGGASGVVLDWEVWDTDIEVFSDFTVERVPHRWQGHSIFDEVEEVQRVKTVLLRQVLDNLYQSNIPDRVVDETRIENPDAIYDRKIGNTIRVRGDPSTAVANLEVPFVAQSALEGLQYMDAVIEKRTGASQNLTALDPETLQNQSATAVNAAQTSSYSRVELMARNLAEMGFRQMFRRLLKIIVANQDRPRTIKLRGGWVEMDPRAWNADMDFDVNVGLGSGSRDRDAMVLQQVMAKQEMIMAQAGPVNPLAGIDRYSNTLRKSIELSGLRNPDQYFGEVGPQEMQQMAQGGMQKPDPKAQAAQAQAQAAMQKAQVDNQISAQQAQAQITLKQQQAQAEAILQQRQIDAQMAAAQQKNALDLQSNREKNAATIQAMRERQEAEIQLAAQKAEFDRQQQLQAAALDAELKQREMMMEYELAQQANAMKFASGQGKQADTNIPPEKVPQRKD